jgi:hypothetical protein
MAGDSVLKRADAARQPREEFTAALDRLKNSLGYYAPELNGISITVCMNMQHAVCSVTLCRAHNARSRRSHLSSGSTNMVGPIAER